MWILFYLLLLLVLGSCVGITVKKIKKDTYNPYFLKHVVVGYSIMGGLFLVASLLFLFQI